ncbi:MAG: hypothetical protein HFG42_13625 [Lachnospiraceae bacterium]|nr:hypothetical protein [Lachnospiraceae bacterium]
MQETYKLPGHRTARAYCNEDAKQIKLVSYQTTVASFNKHNHRVTIYGRYSPTTDKHCRWFLEYLHQRYKKEAIKVNFTFIDFAGIIID